MDKADSTTQRKSASRSRGNKGAARANNDAEQLLDSVVAINRVAKVVKGGRRFSLAACVIVGDGKGRLGMGYGKAKEVPDAIRKAMDQAKKRMFLFSLKDTTIPHEIVGRYKASRVVMKPASKGTGLIAGGSVRSVLEVSGVHDILTKSLGSSNALNVAKATMDGLKRLKDAHTVAQLRGVEIYET